MIRYIHVESPVILLDNTGKRVRNGLGTEYPSKIDIYQIIDGIADFVYKNETRWYLGRGHVEKLKYVIPVDSLKAENDRLFIRSVIRAENSYSPYLNYNMFADANHPRVASITRWLLNNKYPLNAHIDFINGAI